MAMKKNNRDYIAQMNKGMKQKLSMLLIACLLFTGYHGLTISGRAEQEEKEQTNEISVSGTQVKVQLLGEDIRRAAKEAIEKGDRVEAAALQGYSGDEDLQKEYAEIFSSEKAVYEIPLDSISEGLSESLAEEEAGLQVFVERDAKDLERLVRKESKESLLLYDGNSQLSQLFPETKQEETKATVEKEEESGAEEALASDSNIEKTERNTELTGSELITFLYKNKADHRISFQLSVDGNTYPKVVVSPKTQLFKSFLDKLKKEEKKPQAETTVVASTEAKESTAAESTETSKSAEETEESESESAASSVSLVSTEGSVEETTVAETTVVETAEAESAEESAETKGHTTEVTEETEATEETAAESKAAEAVKEKKENFTGFLQEVIEHYEEFLGELQTARFTQYSLNELGRKTQNVEIKDFATVEVFYDEDAFADEEGNTQEVVLKANRLLKKEEAEKEGEKLTDEQVEAMKEHSIYEGSDALDIRFVSKEDETKEIEPKNPVSVRLTFDKKAVPEEANADTIAIHHIVEDKDSGKVKLVETVVRAELEKKAEELAAVAEPEDDEKSLEGNLQKKQTVYSEALKKLEREVNLSEEKGIVTKEFVVSAFSAYIVTWQCNPSVFYGIRFHYVDKNFKEIGPTVYEKITKWEDQIGNNSPNNPIYYKKGDLANSIAYKTFENFEFKDIGGQKSVNAGTPYVAWPELVEGEVRTDKETVYIKGMEMISIDKSGFRWNSLNPKREFYTKFTWGCAYTDFYFIYELKTKENKPKEKNISPTLSNEKFITDNLDGTYDLTLTGQVKEDSNNKQKLDIVFVYDNTAVMATGFGFNEKLKKLSEEDYVKDKDSAKSTKVKNEIKKFIERLSQSDSDVRYALVTMDGDKGFGNIVDDGVRARYDSFDSHYKNTNAILGGEEKDEQGNKDINIVGEYKGDKGNAKVWLDEATDYDGMSSGFNVNDKAYNDTKHVMGFTKNTKDIFDKLGALDERNSTFNNKDKRTVSGENYASAMKNVRTLLRDGTEYEVAEGGSKVREEAEKIVVFIAGGNPKFATIPKKTEKEKKKEEEKKKEGKQYNYIFEDTHRYNDSDYYIIRRSYQEGWSYGNGYSINFPALNQARGELSKLTNIDAFYSIGVGAKTNWKYLNDFAMGQYYDEDGKHRTGENYDEKKHPDRREKALAENVRYKCFDASSEEKLASAFQHIFERVARNHVQNIVIRDVLTNYVQPIMKDDGEPDVIGQLVKMESNGVEVADAGVLKPAEMKKLGLEGFTIEAKKVSASKTGINGLNYDGERWLLTLKTIPEDFALPPGYDIRMVAKVKPTGEAEKKFKSNSGYLERGEERTDLNNIYEKYLKKMYPKTVEKDDGKFNSSAGKLGLFTNEYADISYKTKKPDGSEETPNPKPYNKPIIARGSLTIEKTFKGLEGTIFLNDSTGELTDFGKKILQQLRFEVHVQNLTEIKQDGHKEYTVQKLLPVNFKDDEPKWNGQTNFKEGVTFGVTGTDDLKHNVTIKIERDKENNPQLKITVDNLIPSKQYTVYEYYSGEVVGNKPKGVLDSKKGVSYQLVLDANATNDYPIVSVGGRSLAPSKCKGQTEAFRITNKYKKEDKPKTITIKKVVTPSTKTESTESFRFYLEVFKNDGSRDNRLGYNEYELLKGQLEKANPKYIESNRDFTTGMINIKKPNKKDVMAIFFDIKDGESIQVPLNPNYKVRVYEIIKTGYKKAEIKAEWKNQTDNIQTDNITSQVGNDKNNEFVYMEDIRQVHDGELITFTNPKKLAPPTGLVRDITPYLFSIFGFTLMAGAYFAINQKKRREI